MIRRYGSRNIWSLKIIINENYSFDSELERNGGEAILKGKLNKNDVDNFKISDLFVNETLEILVKGLVQETINVSEEHPLLPPLWQNSLLRIQNTQACRL